MKTFGRRVARQVGLRFIRVALPPPVQFARRVHPQTPASRKKDPPTTLWTRTWTPYPLSPEPEPEPEPCGLRLGLGRGGGTWMEPEDLCKRIEEAKQSALPGKTGMICQVLQQVCTFGCVLRKGLCQEIWPLTKTPDITTKFKSGLVSNSKRIYVNILGPFLTC